MQPLRSFLLTAVGPRTAVAHSWCLITFVLSSVERSEAQGVAGTLVDSLFSEQPLAGATVWIKGASEPASTDSSGRFRLKNLSGGSYALTFSHPAYDSTGVSPPQWRIEVPDTGLHDLVLATPNPDQRFGAVCATPPDPSSGYVIGSVRDAGVDTALAGVTVDVGWTEISRDSQRTVPPTPRRFTARTVTDAAGQFVICPVPLSTELSIHAATNGITTGTLVTNLSRGRVAVRQLTIATKTLATARSHADSALLTALVRGTVRDSTGNPLSGARVSVVGTGSGTAITDGSGGFALSGPIGTQVLAVAALGHSPGWRAVTLRPGENRDLDLALGRTVQTLAPIQVTARFIAAGSLAAIEDRVRRNAGHLLTDRDISKRSPRRFEDLFRGVPGLMVARVPPADGLENFTEAEHAVSSRGIRSLSEVACAPSFLVDGTPINVDFSDAPFPVPISEVRALEMYPSTATAPFEFQRAQSGCGVIVVWTKRGGAGP
jgi:hypothetical protein